MRWDYILLRCCSLIVMLTNSPSPRLRANTWPRLSKTTAQLQLYFFEFEFIYVYIKFSQKLIQENNNLLSSITIGYCTKSLTRLFGLGPH